MLQQIKDEEAGRLISGARAEAEAASGSMRLVDQPAKVDVAFHGPTAEETFQGVQRAIQEKKEEGEIAEAEAAPVGSGVAPPPKSAGAIVHDRDVPSAAPSAALRCGG